MCSKSLRYSLEKYNFKKNTFYGSIIEREEKDLCDIIEEYEGTHARKLVEDIFQKVEGKLQKKLREGHSVKILDYVRLAPILRGIFSGEDDNFDPDRHSIEIVAEAGDALKQELSPEELKLKKIKTFRRQSE